ncbi:tRNA pseudouridine(38-40) synthase TruA [Pricia sp.]|uniref:tRNA pseudouridine(38-40) synthase TruA n=1 Tax=Pricia sp. TaxID=2268138 RepID=UPI00359493AE
MQNANHSYLIRIQYLGFRYSGWQIQPGQRTVEGMVSKTLKFVLPGEAFKILGAGRTDAKVSALDMTFELFLYTALEDTESFLAFLNKNLPPDIRVMSIDPISRKFNIIKDVKTKEYVYLFSFGKKNHPFCAPFLANIYADLDISVMKEAARLFEGVHNFSAYTVKESRKIETTRTITSCKIRRNTLLKANFFPKRSYALYVEGVGFMRYQVRMMMGALIQLGRGELTVSDIEVSLQENNTVLLTYIAPGSGLLINRSEFDLSMESLSKK